MAFDGSGLFARIFRWVTDSNNNINILPDRMDGEDDGFATGLSNCICRDGQSTITADIPFNSHGITGLRAPTAANDALRVASLGVIPPGGRLTLTSGAAVLTSAVNAAGTLFYTPYTGTAVPLWNGTMFLPSAFSELSNVLANSATGNAGPFAAAANAVYDVFVWNNAGTPTLTRGDMWQQTATVTNTNASPAVYSHTAHGLLAGSPVRLAVSGGSLSPNFTAGTTYYVVSPATDTYQLAATVGGSAIAAGGASSGTITATEGVGIATLTSNAVGRGTAAALGRAVGLLINNLAIGNGPAAGYGTYVGTITTDSTGATVSVAAQSARQAILSTHLVNQFNLLSVESGASINITGATSGSTALQASAVASGTLTFPAATDTLVGKATTDTLTNKTLTSPIITGGTLTSTAISSGTISGGTIDNTPIGATTQAAGTFTQVTINGLGALSGTILDQAVKTTSSPTFGNVTVTGLGALSGTILDQAVKSTSSPTFNAPTFSGGYTANNQCVIKVPTVSFTSISYQCVTAPYFAASFARADGTQEGTIQVQGTGTTYNTTSDARVKKNIRDTSIGLETLYKVQVRDFNFIYDGYDEEEHHGFIAQELHEVYPHCVSVPHNTDEIHEETGRPKFPWAIDYGRITPLIVRSVQQLKDENDELKERIERLEEMLSRRAG